jgi:hypothetical protein
MILHGEVSIVGLRQIAKIGTALTVGIVLG